MSQCSQVMETACPGAVSPPPVGSLWPPHSDQFSVFSTLPESQVLDVSLTCLAVKNYGPRTVFLISRVSVLHPPSQRPRKVTCMDVRDAHCTIPGASCMAVM